MFDGLASRWHVFWYNFAWYDYAKLLNGTPSKLAIVFPLIGYAILFNDYVVSDYGFKSLTGEVKTHLFLNTDLKLRFAFIGMMLVAFANVFYKVRRPYMMRHGESQIEFNKTVDELFTYGDLLGLHNQIRRSGFDPLTRDGKYYDEEWEAFSDDCVWPEIGQGVRERSIRAFREETRKRNFSEAKQRHSSLVRSILRETYFRECRGRRTSLVVCVFAAIVGYTLILLPSLDLSAVILFQTLI